ncbi:hypothetical protein MTO96_020467 [Rhipicephalus appendiculatus]
MEAGKNDFMQQYKTISLKLKKRFLRKPNLAEVSDQYTALGKQLQHQDCPSLCRNVQPRCRKVRAVHGEQRSRSPGSGARGAAVLHR